MEPDLKREQSHHPRQFADFTYAYPVLSRRSGGISIGVNLNLDKHCNFACPYCQVDRTIPRARQAISIPAIRSELEQLLGACDAMGVFGLERFRSIASQDKQLKDIAISGDGEPTMAPEFPEVCKMLSQLQAARPELNFKLILITNSTLLDKPLVLDGIRSLLSIHGEVWAKLDAGTNEWYQKVNVSRIGLDRIETNLMQLGKHHSYKIQSLFCGLDAELPSATEIDAYLKRLERIKFSGSDIQEVQLHTLARKPAQQSCTPVSGEFLQAIREKIETQIGLTAKVYGMEN
jgi:wyosine [tRNA(Phe)-imidazoG37] synthetase (radical SAM superfamily)